MIATIGRRRVLVLSRRLLATAAAAATIVLTGGVGEAQAHGELVGTDPADGQKVVTALRQVVLHFDEPVQSAEVTVRGEDGRSISVGTAALADSDIRQRVDLEVRGSYVVSWRIVSDDGHPETGDLTFQYANPAAPQGSDHSKTAGTSPATGSGTPAEGSSALWWLVGVASAGLAGLAGFVARDRLRERRHG